MSSKGRFSAGRKPRVVMVSANAYPVMGGVETHVNEVAPRVAAAGFDVTILTTDRSGELPRRDVLGGVSTLRGVPAKRVGAWPARRDWYFAPGILRDVALGDWDLVHCQGYHTFVPALAMLGAITTKKPFLLTFHSGGHGSQLRTRLRGPQRGVLRPLLARARKLVAVSQFEARFFARELRLPPSRFVTIQNGAAMAWPDAGDTSDDESPLILSVGRLERYKGHHRLIEALPAILRVRPMARLRIVGAGPYDAELRRLAASSPVSDRIEVGSIDPSNRSGMAAVLASASLVCLLSEYEANPVAVMEALALRRRVLVADTSGLSELATSGLARAIPIDSNTASVATAVVEQLATPAPQEFDLPTWDESAASLVDVYREILGLR
ncbi:MAG TPA: glycosyltransferase family 4 protein [Candidatus Limnocylindrales bacterium]|nr:glycosyltransferase family 4 protein [Candidatus Limnocylindrales bacterium]